MTAKIFARAVTSTICLCALLTCRTVAADFDQSHALLDGVLKRHVKSARVDYASLKAHPEELNRYLDQVAAVSKAEFKKWSEHQQIAFLSNAYNAYTLKLIADHFPLKSIKDIGSFFSGPWDQPVVRLFGQVTTLGQIEHGMLRKEYDEPRIHFALVCGAKGCPPLRAEAYTGSRLEVQLVDQARQFLAETNKNRVSAAERTIYLSPIFKWFAGDFEKSHGSVTAALRPYWAGNVLATDGFRIRYTDYDWSLNAQGQ